MPTLKTETTPTKYESIKKQYKRACKQALNGYFEQDVNQYVKGRTRFILSSFLTVILIIIGAKTSVIPTANATIVLLSAWAIYNIMNPSARFFITSLVGFKTQIAEFMNSILTGTGLNWRYYNDNNSKKTARKIIKDTNAFERYSDKNVIIHNAVHGSHDGISFESFTVEVYQNHENTRRGLFDGTVYVIDLPVPDDYYLQIRPKVLRRGVRISLGFYEKDIRVFQKDTPNRFVPEDFEEITNDPKLTARILNENIRPLFDYLSPKELLRNVRINMDEFLSKNSPDVIQSFEPFIQKRQSHRIDMLYIVNGKAYVFFPKRIINEHSDYRFDILTPNHINPDEIWDDIKDMFERIDILKQIKGQLD